MCSNTLLMLSVIVGTDENAIIEVLAGHINYERQEIKKMYKTMFGQVKQIDPIFTWKFQHLFSFAVLLSSSVSLLPVSAVICQSPLRPIQLELPSLPPLTLSNTGNIQSYHFSYHKRNI